MNVRICLAAAFGFVLLGLAPSPLSAQSAPEPDATRIREKLSQLQDTVTRLRESGADRQRLADVEVFAKAAEWILRHDEFYRPRYVKDTLTALETGLERAEQLDQGNSPWLETTGSVILGYYSRVDGSVQPYALSLPEGVNPRAPKRWPLHVKLHGRGGTRNEVRFIREHTGKSLVDEQSWIQLDVFGRTDNAYR